jgi:glycosyltransferase involved in cell wall biosynthesis
LRILVAAPRFPPDARSGAEQALKRLYRQARLHHEVRLVAGWRRARDLVPAEAVAVDLAGLGPARALARFGRVVRKEVSRWKPDIVLTGTARLPPVGAPCALLAQEREGAEPEGLRGLLRSRLETARARAFDGVIAPTAAAARALVKEGMPESKLRVIPNGIDERRFKPRPRAHVPGDDTIRVLHVSRVMPGKGQHHAIDAVARLRRGHKSRVQLSIVGGVGDAVYLDQIRVQAYGQPVRFALDVPDVVPHYDDCDIVVLPTELPEASGLVAVEAMACGRPVIWFDHPTVRETTAGIGVPVPPGDAGALRDALARLMDDPAERQRLGERGRRYVLGNRTWGRTWSAYETALQAIARP